MAMGFRSLGRPRADDAASGAANVAAPLASPVASKATSPSGAAAVGSGRQRRSKSKAYPSPTAHGVTEARSLSVSMSSPALLGAVAMAATPAGLSSTMGAPHAASSADLLRNRRGGGHSLAQSPLTQSPLRLGSIQEGAGGGGHGNKGGAVPHGKRGKHGGKQRPAAWAGVAAAVAGASPLKTQLGRKLSATVAASAPAQGPAVSMAPALEALKQAHGRSGRGYGDGGNGGGGYHRRRKSSTAAVNSPVAHVLHAARRQVQRSGGGPVDTGPHQGLGRSGSNLKPRRGRGSAQPPASSATAGLDTAGRSGGWGAKLKKLAR